MKKVLVSVVLMGLIGVANAQSSGLGGACNSMVQAAYDMKNQGVSQSTVQATQFDLINKHLPSQVRPQMKRLSSSIIDATYKGASLRDMKNICKSI